MKASFVILALIQGLALATPARPKYDESLKELLDDSATQPFNSKMLDAEQRAASGSPAELQEMKRAHQRQVLPGECFDATKQIQPYCDSIYHTCGRIHLSGPDFVGTWKSDAQLKRFEHCVNVRLKHGLEFHGGGIGSMRAPARSSSLIKKVPASFIMHRGAGLTTGTATSHEYIITFCTNRACTILEVHALYRHVVVQRAANAGVRIARRVYASLYAFSSVDGCVVIVLQIVHARPCMIAMRAPCLPAVLTAPLWPLRVDAPIMVPSNLSASSAFMPSVRIAFLPSILDCAGIDER
ncbi:hypothetical protein Purlil1_10418 [Purpureocillium lilacinum]|uniref:Uncharacterized protein n=1 Tax=Purpureocillium lilacinum TaxID=33203 RepID=A0ABR0BMH0_PURLI|nr:hypothetical protein Purlil1_10418 [Purpureocillium lilacinum]